MHLRRFVVTVAPEDVWAFESILEERATCLGRVTDDGYLRARYQGRELLQVTTAELRHAWTNGPVNQTLGLEPAGQAK
jgi:phosphoribosylformylglycinamidine (FGAM) synthase-like enzyme